jgi:flagellar basal body P-ring protein FlgI
MYSNPAYYSLLFVSTLIFFIYINAVRKNNKSEDFELLDTTIVDNSAYWVYNRSLYHANFDNDSINKSTIKKLNNFGMDADEMHSVIKEFGKL